MSTPTPIRPAERRRGASPRLVTRGSQISPPPSGFTEKWLGWGIDTLTAHLPVPREWFERVEGLIGQIEAMRTRGANPDTNAWTIAELRSDPGLRISPDDGEGDLADFAQALGLWDTEPLTSCGEECDEPGGSAGPQPAPAPAAPSFRGTATGADRHEEARCRIGGGGRTGYSYSVELEDGRKLFVPSMAGLENGQMGVMVQWPASWLATHKRDEIRPAAEELIAAFLGEDFPARSLNVNRLDIRTDKLVEKMPPELLDEDKRVCRGKHWQTFGFGKRRTGVRCGKSVVVFRSYDKCDEAKKDHDLDFWREVWGVTKADIGEGTVQRFEWQLRKDYVKAVVASAELLHPEQEATIELEWVLAHLGDLMMPLVVELQVEILEAQAADGPDFAEAMERRMAPEDGTGEVLERRRGLKNHTPWLLYCGEPEGKYHERPPLPFWADYQEQVRELCRTGELQGEGICRGSGGVRSLEEAPLLDQMIGCAMAHEQNAAINARRFSTMGQWLQFNHQAQEWRMWNGAEPDIGRLRDELREVWRFAYMRGLNRINDMADEEVLEHVIHHIARLADKRWYAAA